MIIWFGLVVVVLPALLSTASLLIFDYLWLSTDVLAKSEMDSAITMLRLDEYFAALMVHSNVLAEASHAAHDVSEYDSTLTPPDRAELLADRAMVKRYWQRNLLEARWQDRPPDTRALQAAISAHFKASERGSDHAQMNWIAAVIDEGYRNRQVELEDIRLQHDRDLLTQLAGNDQTTRDLLGKVDRISKKSILSGDSESVAGTILNYAAALKELFLLSDVVMNYSKQHVSILSAIRMSQQNQRSLMFCFAAGGFFASLGLALALVAMYTKYINSRLLALVKIAEKIPCRGSTFPLFGGNDELAYLQSVLVEVHSGLNALDASRRFVVGMVAHDVRSPLMATRVSLGLARDSCVEPQTAKIIAVRRGVESVITIVDEMLSIERETLGSSESHAVSEIQPNSVRSSVSTLFASGMFKKVAILVATPLILQSCWLLWIGDRLNVTQALSLKQQALANTMLDIGKSCALGVHAITSHAIYSLSGKQKLKDYYLEDRSELDTIYKRLKTAAYQTAFSTGFASELRTFIDHIDSVLGDAVVMPTPLEARSTQQQWALKARHTKEQLELPLKKLYDQILGIGRQGMDVAKLEAQYLEFANSVQRLIVAGLAANIFVSLLLFFFFSRNINRRLTLLLASAGSLAQPGSADITVGGRDELSVLANELNAARAQLKEAMEHRIRMISSIADNLSAPLVMAQRAITQLSIDEGVLIDEEARVDLLAAQQSIDKAIELINDLLTVERLESGVLTLANDSYPVKEIVDESLGLVHSLAVQKGIAIIPEILTATVKVDKLRIVQALVNLLSNAIKFSPAGSEVTVRVENTVSGVKFSVSDQGPGMDAITAGKVFDKFFQGPTGQQHRGFGLGLAICKLIVELHGGTINVESTRNKGSIFSITLPQE
jgi:signal transduction histidine kinase